MSKVTAQDIRAGINKRWAQPEYAVMWEVGEATGAVNTRYADAVIMSLWPSRGLELHGVEIKVSAPDWRRESADPRKAEAIGKFCDRWWVITSPGVIKDASELPPLWGWREFDGTKFTTLKEAALRPDPEPTSRRFLAALLRRADETVRRSTYEAAQRMVEADKAAFEERVAGEVERRTRRNTECTKIVEAFEAASGIQMGAWTSDPAEVGRLVKAFMASGIDGWGGLPALHASTLEMADKLEKAMAASGLPFKPRNENALKVARIKKR